MHQVNPETYHVTSSSFRNAIRLDHYFSFSFICVTNVKQTRNYDPVEFVKPNPTSPNYLGIYNVHLLAHFHPKPVQQTNKQTNHITNNNSYKNLSLSVILCPVHPSFSIVACRCPLLSAVFSRCPPLSAEFLCRSIEISG